MISEYVFSKFMFSKKATKIDKIFTIDLTVKISSIFVASLENTNFTNEKIFTVNLTVCSNRQIDGEDFVNCCGLLKKHELYML